MSIDINTVIQRNDTRFLANKIGEEMVMMDMETGDFVTMNVVGADIWALAEQPVAVKSLAGQLLQEYGTAPEKCIEDTLRFLQNSEEYGFFTIVNSVAAE